MAAAVSCSLAPSCFPSLVAALWALRKLLGVQLFVCSVAAVLSCISCFIAGLVLVDDMTTFTAAKNHRGGPASPSRGSRQLFPIPLLSLDVRPDFGKNNRGRQLWIREQKILMDINGVLNSLNWMAGCRSSTTAAPSPMQREVIMRVDGLVRRKQPSARPLHP